MEESHPSKPKGPQRRRLPWRVFHIFGVVTTLAGVWFGSYYFEDIKHHFPDLITAQLRVYNKISQWEARTPRAKWVVGVEIDNETFFKVLNLDGEHDITDRAFLAHVIDNAVKANAAVIALDIDLVRDKDDETDRTRRQKNRALYDAISRASRAGIPVVLTFGFDIDADTATPVKGNIEDPTDPDVRLAKPDHVTDLEVVRPVPAPGREQILVPMCLDANNLWVYDPRAGWDNGSDDMRKVPLVTYAGRNRELACSSFALQVVDAYERSTRVAPLTRWRLRDLIRHGQYVYTAFLPQCSFPRVSAVEVYRGKPAALAALHHRIVLIGGNRTLRADTPARADSHDSPAGPMVGMYYHANYIEGMLDDRIKAPVARWKAALLDVLLAASVMWLVWRLRRKSLRKLMAFLMAVFVAIALAYVAFVNLGFVLDGVAMLLLLVLHTIYEHYLHLFERAHSGGD